MRNVFISILIIYACACKDYQDTNKSAASHFPITKDSLKRFIIRSANAPVAELSNELSAMLSSLNNDSAAFRQAATFLEKPFADPNSGFRNETLYIDLLNQQLKSAWYIDIEKEVVRKKLHLAMQNQVGNIANDFQYFTPKGTPGRMHDINAPFTLLYFYNPECHACQETKTMITSSTILTQNIQSGRIKLLAIYTDIDQAIWKKHLAENPKQWINGRDTSEYLWRNKIYDLRAIPTLYLLDEKKKVLLKDATVNQINDMLSVPLTK